MGNSDGSVNGVRYFQSKKDSAVFVGMDRLSILNPVGSGLGSPRLGEDRKKLGKKQDRTEVGALSVGRSHFYDDTFTDKVLCKGIGNEEEEFVDWYRVQDPLMDDGCKFCCIFMI